MVFRPLTFIYPYKNQWWEGTLHQASLGKISLKRSYFIYLALWDFTQITLKGRTKASGTNIWISFQPGHCISQSSLPLLGTALAPSQKQSYLSLVNGKQEQSNIHLTLCCPCQCKFSSLAEGLSCLCSKRASSCWPIYRKLQEWSVNKSSTRTQQQERQKN